MDNRTDIRPNIRGINNIENKTIKESFQNKSLRPILKLQHDLLIAYFKTYISSKKSKFENMSNLQKIKFIKNVFTKDNTFKTELKGLIIGHFTIEEYTIYIQFKREFNKRILTMAEQRLMNSMCRC